MRIRFLLDENIPFDMIEFLRKRDFDVIHLKKIGKCGINNEELCRIAEEDDLWILTRDSDFKSYQKFVTHNIKGVIVFALTDTMTNNILNMMSRFIETHHAKLLSKNLIIIEDHKVIIYDADEIISKTDEPLSLDLDENECNTIIRALQQTGGIQTRAAELLGISRRAIHYKIKKYGIKSSDIIEDPH